MQKANNNVTNVQNTTNNDTTPVETKTTDISNKSVEIEQVANSLHVALNEDNMPTSPAVKSKIL